jgi:hypothetical protein
MKTETVRFLDMGDLCAPKGSPRWCIAVREEARAALRNAKASREHVLRWVRALREDDRFRGLTDADGNHFLSWEGFCAARPPHGFGMTAEAVEDLCGLVGLEWLKEAVRQLSPADREELARWMGEPANFS